MRPSQIHCYPNKGKSENHTRNIALLELTYACIRMVVDAKQF